MSFNCECNVLVPPVQNVPAPAVRPQPVPAPVGVPPPAGPFRGTAGMSPNIGPSGASDQEKVSRHFYIIIVLTFSLLGGSYYASATIVR